MSLIDENLIISHEVFADKDFKRKYILEVYASRVRLVLKSDSDAVNDLYLSDLTGCQCMKGKKADDQAAYLSLYYYKHKKPLLKSQTKRTRNVIVVQFKSKQSYEDNQKIADKIRIVLFNVLRDKAIEGRYICSMVFV